MFKLFDDVKNGMSPLSPQTRAVLGGFISTLNHCDYCTANYQQTAEALGVDVRVFKQLQRNFNKADIDARLKPLLFYVKKLTLTPQKITAADAQAVFTAGWDEAAFLDVVCLCATVNCINRLVMGVGIQADQPDVGSFQLPLMVGLST